MIKTSYTNVERDAVVIYSSDFSKSSFKENTSMN